MPTHSTRRNPQGFTLVELLVTIAIIAILLGLLLPAVQSVRASGRVAQCRNNIRQIAMGCIAHEQSHGCFPGAGGGYGNTGDPDQGFGHTQGGGWPYSILPFIEQVNLHQLGAGATNKNPSYAQRIGTVVPMYVCPDRGSGLVTRGNGSSAQGWFGANPFARTDYGGNREGLIGAHGNNQPRVIYAHQVTDGLSNVLLCGERNLDPDRYHRTGLPGSPDRYDCNEQGWTTGADHESLCRGSPATNLNFHMPIQDTPGVASVAGFPSYGAGIAYGSPHASFHVAMAGGDVRSVNYTIQDTVLSQLSKRDDGKGVAEDLGD
jgi:prepilin-type N-terminal cleavage/methylation domain-containing protein